MARSSPRGSGSAGRWRRVVDFGFGRLGFGSADPPNAETAFELEVPKAYAARSFTIWTGFYRGQKRLRAKSANARVDEDRVSGPEISVGECARR